MGYSAVIRHYGGLTQEFLKKPNSCDAAENWGSVLELFLTRKLHGLLS